MHTWEYFFIARNRSWGPEHEGGYFFEATPWEIWIDGKKLEDPPGALAQLQDVLARLGNEGWELVSVTPRSGYLGEKYSNSDYAGFTDSELWVFKRPKS